MPTGSVEFYDGSTDLGHGSALSGSGTSATSTLTTSTLTVGSHSINAVYTPTGDFVGSSGSLTQTVNIPPATASFNGKDTTTEGSWIGVYGSQGYNVINATNGVNYPSYATVTPAGNTAYTWAANTNLVQALQNPSGTGRIAAAWYTPSTSFTVDVDLTDGQSHNLELYLLDYDTTSRSEKIVFTDANTHAVLSTQSVSSFSHRGLHELYDLRERADHDHQDGGCQRGPERTVLRPDGVPHHHRRHLLAQPVDLRPVGDLHGHRQRHHGGVPTGSVEFYDGSTDLGPGSALSGSGTSATSTLTISTLAVSEPFDPCRL